MSEEHANSLLLNQFIPYRMVNMAKRISDSCSRIYMDDFEVTVAEWRILARLAEHVRQNAREIGTVTFMDKSMVSRAVKLLHDKGYINKDKDPNDARASWLSLTESGRALYESIAPKALDWESRLISALDVSEYRDLMRILEKMDRQLDVMDEEPLAEAG